MLRVKKKFWKTGRKKETLILSWQGREQELFDRWGGPNKVDSLPSSIHHFHRKAPTRKGGRGGEGVDHKCQLAKRKGIFCLYKACRNVNDLTERRESSSVKHSVFQTVNILSNGSLQ